MTKEELRMLKYYQSAEGEKERAVSDLAFEDYYRLQLKCLYENPLPVNTKLQGLQ